MATDNRSKGQVSQAVERGEEEGISSFRRRFGGGAAVDTGQAAQVFNDDNTEQPRLADRMASNYYPPNFEMDGRQDRQAPRGLRAAQPVIGATEMREQERRAGIDASIAGSRARRDAGPRMSRGYTGSQQQTLAGAPNAQDFLSKRLQNRMAARTPDPRMTDARDAQMRQDESLRMQKTAREGLAAEERMGLRQMGSNERIADVDAESRREVAEIRNAGQGGPRGGRGGGDGQGNSQGNSGWYTSGEEGSQVNWEGLRNSPELAQESGTFIAGRTAAALTASNMFDPETINEGQIGQLAGSWIQNSAREEFPGRPSTPEGLERLFVGAQVLARMGGEDFTPASSAKGSVEQFLDMAPSENNRWFRSGTTARAGGAEFDLSDLQGPARTAFNELRDVSKEAAIAMHATDPKRALKALSAITELEVAEAEAAFEETSGMGTQTARLLFSAIAAGEIDGRLAPGVRESAQRVLDLQNQVSALEDGDWRAFDQARTQGADEDLQAQASAAGELGNSRERRGAP